MKKGDRIGLVAPASPFKEDPVRKGIAFLESRGFLVSHLPDLFIRRRGFLAGEDEQRAGELMAMFEDPGIDAVFVVRGGYGSQRILARLDPQAISRNPKIVIGYSDVSVLLSFLVDRCGMACFHGPMVREMGALSPLTEEHMLRALTVPGPMGRFPLGDVRWIRQGHCRGRLVGGNLTVLSCTLGTPWEFRTEGRVLFLEDRGEEPYRIDRMLVQMRQAGKFADLAGLMFGDMLPGREGEDLPGGDEAVFEVLADNTADLNVPVLCGLPVGHGTDNLTLPVGVEAEIDSAGEGLTILESAIMAEGIGV